jgi:hypothetical protein
MFLDVVTKGTTDYSVTIRIVDSTDGTPETGVVYNTSGIDLWYRRPGGAHTSITEATQTEGGAHTDGGFIHISDGYYRLDLPDAAVATGVDYVDVGGTVTGMVVIGGRIRLTDFDLSDSVRGGLTALPNAAADAAGGLAISDAGGLDLDGLNTNVSAILADTGTDGVVVATASKTGYRLSATGVDDIFDEALSGHVTAGSFGAAMYVIRSATAQAGASTTITLDASASATDDFYNNQKIHIVSGTGVGQGTYITDYNGTTKVATVQDTWRVNPSSDSVFVILPAGGIPGASAPTAAAVADAVWDEAYGDHTSEGSFGSIFQPPHEGTAQAATSTTITLDATGSSSTDDFYNYGFIQINGGTGAGQKRQISDYNGTSKVATVSLPWIVTPSTDSQYVLLPEGIDAATVASIADGVWDEARSGHVAAGTFGEYVLSDALRVSGSSSAADGLEAAVSGATPLPSNVTQFGGAAGTFASGRAEVNVSHVGGSAEDLPTATALATVDSNVDAILVDTGTTIPALLGTPAADLAADIAAIKSVADAVETDTQDIQSRLPAALSAGGFMMADMEAVNGVSLDGDGSAVPFTV